MKQNNLNNPFDKHSTATVDALVFVLASVLKYAKDVRMYEKIGKSLIKKYKNATFHFVGNTSTQSANNKENESENIHLNIHFYELFNFNRIAFRRVFTFFTFFFFLLKTKPNAIIIGTFELLLPAAFYKIICLIFLRKKVKIIYDIQENYCANIKYTKVFPFMFRWIIAFYVGFVEKISSFLVDFFFLAENCYEQELTFIGKKYTVLPNFILRENYTEIEKLTEKSTKNSVSNSIEETTNLLFLGTISKEYGLYKILSYFVDYQTNNQQESLQEHQKENQKENQKIKLSILGHCPLKADFLEIEKISKENPFINAQISQKPIPYTQIKEKMKTAMQENTFVVMPYIINKSYEKRIPTKFYECLAYNLPMIIQKNKYWEDFFGQMQKLIPMQKINVFFIDFDDKKHLKEHLKIILKMPFQNNENTFSVAELPIFWDICERKLNEISF